MASLSSVKSAGAVGVRRWAPGDGNKGWQGEQPVNNKIYYPSGRLREGADRDRCSLELAVRYGERGGRGRGESLRGWRKGLSVAPVRGLRTWKYESSEVADNFTQKSSPHRLDSSWTPPDPLMWCYVCLFLFIKQDLHQWYVTSSEWIPHVGSQKRIRPVKSLKGG